MNVAELKRELERLKIPRHSYRIMGELYPNEAMCLIYEDDFYKCYYSERGQRTGEKTFHTESEACQYFLDTFKNR